MMLWPPIGNAPFLRVLVLDAVRVLVLDADGRDRSRGQRVDLISPTLCLCDLKVLSLSVHICTLGIR